MKKIILFLFLLFPFKISAISASSYIVMDGSSGRVISGNHYNDKRLIASITKIMTCIVAIENGNINQDVEVSNEVLKAYGSAIYIEVGEKLKLKDLLYGLMLRSGNDAAIEVAINVSGSIDKFVDLMNEKAKVLGMTNTIFVNPSGLEEKTGANYSTSYDMALLMKYALTNDLFKEIISTKEYKVTTNYKTYLWHNKNRLLNEYKYLIGGKTGYTEKAKRTLVTAASKDNKTLIIVTLNDPNDFANHKSLYEKYFDKYELVKVLDKNTFNLNDSKYDGKLYIENDYNVLVTNKEEELLNVEYVMDNEIIDNKVGKAVIKISDKKIGEVPIYLNDDKKENNLWNKLLDFIVFWK